jgi:hypothetical protein
MRGWSSGSPKEQFTTRRAADVQGAQFAAASVAETLAGADTYADGLAALGITDGGEPSVAFARDGYDMRVEAERKGDYPGVLYRIKVSASKEGKTLASIETAKYYGGQAHD